VILHKLYYVDWEVLSFSDVVRHVKVTIDLLPLDSLGSVTLLADKSEPCLTPFNLDQLFGKIFSACASISGLGSTMF
jgi:hypothetical protein